MQGPRLFGNSDLFDAEMDENSQGLNFSHDMLLSYFQFTVADYTYL